MLAQYNGAGLPENRVVWYNGTSTLQEGYLVVYDLDDTNAPVDLPAGSLTVPPTSSILPRNLRGSQVIDPVTANFGAVAGVVAAESTNVTGPAWITINVPRTGDTIEVYTNQNCTKGVTVLGPVNGSNIAGAATVGTLAATVVALETVDKSGTAGTVLSKFL